MPELSYKPDEVTSSILDVTPEGVAIHDLEGRLLYVNRWLMEMLGYSRFDRQQITGRQIQDFIHPEDIEETQIAIQAMMATQKPVRVNESRLLRRDGSQLYVNVLGIPFEYEGNNAVQIIVHDLSEQQRLEEELRLTEDRYRKSLALAGLGVWDLDFAEQRVTLSEKVGPMFGMEEGRETALLEEILAAIHPEDVDMVEAAIQRAVEQDVPFEAEYRTLQRDGSVKWLAGRGAVTRNRQGEVTNMMGTVQEITRVRRLQTELQNRNAILQFTQTALTDFVLESDFNLIVEKMLNGLMQLTGSQFGLLGEVFFLEEGRPHLKVLSNRLHRDGHEHDLQRTINYNCLDSLYGEVLMERHTVIRNSLSAEEKQVLPDNHPDIDSFLAVPVFYAGKLVGVYALADSPGGYDEELIHSLLIFNVSFAVVLHARQISMNEKKMMFDLQHARDEAIKANQTKSEFLSNMSHELRTPLNAILGFAQLLQMDDYIQQNSEQNGNVDEIIRAGRHLLSLVSDVLDLARIEAGRMDVNIETVEPGLLLQECLSLMRGNAYEYQVTLHPPDSGKVLPRVKADHTRLLQVVINLISNAIKYNHRGGEVWVDAQLDEARHMLRISVRDNGTGISREQQLKLFRRFERLGRDHSTQGTGIGLVLSRQLTYLMSGEMGFVSEEGEGSTFWVAIPLA